MFTSGDAAASMRKALTALLDSVPISRTVFRHLAAVERALKNQVGAGDFLADVSSDHLSVINKQLESLLGDAPPRALTELGAIIREAIKLRLQDDAGQPISSFFVDHKLEVSEASPSDFEQLHADWIAPAPPQR